MSTSGGVDVAAAHSILDRLPEVLGPLEIALLLLDSRRRGGRRRTPETDKRHVLYDAAHDVMVNRTEVVKEVLSWLDQYLGPVAR